MDVINIAHLVCCRYQLKRWIWSDASSLSPVHEVSISDKGMQSQFSSVQFSSVQFSSVQFCTFCFIHAFTHTAARAAIPVSRYNGCSREVTPAAIPVEDKCHMWHGTGTRL